MVATRRGVRVYSPTKTEPNQSSDVQATPATCRRTRRTVKEADSPTQHALLDTRAQLDKSEDGSPTSPPTTSMKRCTRASRLHSPEQPSTPVGSIHEVDLSDVESCSSAMSDIELLVSRIRGRRRQACTVSQEEEEISEVESCLSSISASKTGQSGRRSTRKKTVPASSACVEGKDVKSEQVTETESCSSVVSEFKRVTRSQRKMTRTRLSTKKQTDDSEVSDAESCVSSVSGADFSTTRRNTRSSRKTHPIPMHLDDASDSSRSPAPTGRCTRATRAKSAASADVSEPQSCDSEGFESGPIYSIATRRRGKIQSTPVKAMDSEPELTDVHSPMGSSCSPQGIGTPCSSRTGSGNSSLGALTSRRSVKDCSVVVEIVDSSFETTVIAGDADCTLLEEDKSQTLEEQGVNCTDQTPDEAFRKGAEKEVNVISEEDFPVSPTASCSPGCSKPAVGESAVITKHQQEELSNDNKDGDTSEMEKMQEVIPSSEPLKPCQSASATICGRADVTEEKDEAMDDDTRSPQGGKTVDEGAVTDTKPSVLEKMQISTLNIDDQQVVYSSEAQVGSIQVTSSQQHKISVECVSEKQPTDVIVQNTKMITLLESSDEEDECDEDQLDGSEEEDSGGMDEERGRPSKKSEVAAASVEGLFMVDTRPGQDADDFYYKERPTEQEEGATDKKAEQEEQDEEFVDEQGDDDDDEDAEILFSSRNPQSKELSSRIDPGIRVKELGGLYINFDGSKSKPVSSSPLKLKEKKIQDEVMKKSVIGPDFEKKDSVPPYSESKEALKLKRRAEREKSTGDGWFNMKAPEISQELKGDLQVLKMRSSLDPKRFYKKNDRDGFPKYFQVGSVVDSAADFYHSRIPKKERKRTMVEELLADAEFRHNNKKKYQHIMMEKAAQGAGKRNKKKNKFQKK
ncbi:Deoxynucleotidyltransferase terminal-interacting protein 2 [Channa argus]|uniref:Deoxynucleotidyltransferase terminal-interacting protein 2 n=1 Tax=Channa argus TaxID=215402 RepID=A0A6G1PL78_CHAAH|nr:Deoxynucleotidyltransferase terminal-interacting protein 2 [Channa argus]